MQSRLDRYEQFIREDYRGGFIRSTEYSVDEISPDLATRIADGIFTRVVFSGMGCSAIVSDVIRAFLTAVDCPLEVYVFNDYDFRSLVPRSVIEDERTLIVISSYSGHSQEPIRLLADLEPAHDRVLALTSGGMLGEQARKAGVSIARWELVDPDREYPLFHVGQYFAIILDMFFRLGLIASDYRSDLAALPAQLASDFTPDHHRLAERAADLSQDANIVMIASPIWHEGLLKLAKMHINEMAMAPATRNYFHEFCHSEVATLSDPSRRHVVLLFVDGDDDDYTRNKMRNLALLLTENRPENSNIAVFEVALDQPSFVRKYFTALEFIQHFSLRLGRAYSTRSRDLISEAAGNRWYHSSTILAELDA